MTEINPIGDPPRSVDVWLDSFAVSSESRAFECTMPWNRARYFARAKAFREAADLVRRAMGKPESYLLRDLE